MSERSRGADLGASSVVESGSGDPFAAAFRSARVPMVITDPRQDDNPIIFANDAFLELTGFDRQEVVGRNCRFLQGPDTDRADVARIRAAVAAGQGIEIELLNYRKDGTPFWTAVVIDPVRNAGGELVHFFASHCDITDKKAAALALSQAKASLESEVERRTRDLQAALDRTTVLLHEVEHRVKNNLQVVASLILLKARRIGDEAAQRVLYDMAERISALAMVHRLLYSAGDVSRFDLGRFLADLSNDLVGSMKPGQVALALDVEPVAVPAAKAAPLALLVNELVLNALKHAFPDGRRGHLNVTAARRVDDIRIVVADDGIGMAGHGPKEESFGSMLVDLLARQLRANLTIEDARPGTRAVVDCPLDAEEASP